MPPLIINGTGSSRPTGTSHAVGVSAASVGDYESVVLMAEADMGAITAPLDYVVRFNGSHAIDATTVYIAVYERTSDGDASAHTFDTANSLRVAMIRSTLTGDSGQDGAGPVYTQEAAAGDPTVNTAKTPAFPAGDSVCIGVLDFFTLWDRLGLGAVQGTGPSDTSSLPVTFTRCLNYGVGTWLLPLGDDPFQIEFPYGV